MYSIYIGLSFPKFRPYLPHTQRRFWMDKSKFLGRVGGFLVMAGLILAGAEYTTNQALVIGGLTGVAMMASGVIILRRTSI